MRIGRLRKMNGFWRGLSFIDNQCKMRTTLMEYLHEEGLKCQLEDGILIFEFNECNFHTQFTLHNGFAECEISYQCGGEDYEALEMQDKTFIADKVNTEMDNHCTVLAFNDNFRVNTSFYFSNKRMLLNLFSQHFEELTESIEMTMDIACDKVEAHKAYKSRRIGFNAEPCNKQQIESEKIQAIKRSQCWITTKIRMK